MLFRRGKRWWYEFEVAGRRIRESSRSTSKTVARAAELARRREVEMKANGVVKREPPVPFSVAAKAWLRDKAPVLSPRSLQIEKVNLENHLVPFFGSDLLVDITGTRVAAYQAHRLEQKARPKTINLEVGTLRGILRRHRLWAAIQPDVRMLQVHNEVGRALTLKEERRLLDACAANRSRVLLPVVTVALTTGLRYGEIVSLKWGQIDLIRRTVRVGTSKTAAGRGRLVPLNDRAVVCLQTWAERFPKRKPEHYVFPHEFYGLAGDDAVPHAWGTNPRDHVKRLKEAYGSAKTAAGVTARFHDLRHTFATRLVEAGVSLPVLASIMGWSAATTVLMTRRYGHIGDDTKRQAVEAAGVTPPPVEPEDEAPAEETVH